MVNYFGFLLPKKLEGDLYIFRVCLKFFVLIGSYGLYNINYTEQTFKSSSNLSFRSQTYGYRNHHFSVCVRACVFVYIH